jgi:DNA polymerase III subunit gamma/tau
LDATALRRLWPEVLEIVKQSSRRARALLDNAQITAVDGEQVTLSAPAALARMIADDSNTTILRAALTKAVGGSWRVLVEPEGGGTPAQAAARTPDAPAREPEPDPRDDVDYEPAGAAPAAADPETEAVKLLQNELGARPIEGT